MTAAPRTPGQGRPPTAVLPDIETLNADLYDGVVSRADVLKDVVRRATEASAAAVFLGTSFDSAIAQAAAADASAHAITPHHPLAGLPVSIKDLYDVAGQPTRAGSAVRHDAAPATADAPVVRRLRDTGAALVGRTNMSEFGTTALGINPFFGSPLNPADRTVARICGGSSSGAAASVALGLSVAALGSDTGGSIRIPAALCGITGFKPTARRVPVAGVFPLSTTLDTACAMARTVRDCLLLDSVIADTPLMPVARPVAALRLALPRQLVLDELDATVSRAFERALAALSIAGVHIEQIDLHELTELPSINEGGGFTAAEAYAIHRHELARRRGSYDPRVATRIERGAAMSAADYVDLLRIRLEWIGRVEARLAGFDALICPTVPIVAPAIAPLLADDALFASINALLLRNTSIFNFLDGCSITMPCHQPGELPVGLMLSHGPMRDEELLGTAIALEPIVTMPPDR